MVNTVKYSISLLSYYKSLVDTAKELQSPGGSNFQRYMELDSLSQKDNNSQQGRG
jgi:hypothetical protein